MSFPRYPKYKDSGVAWLGDVPEHWVLCAFKQQIRMRYGDALATDLRQAGDVEVFGSNGAVGTHSLANAKAPAIVVGRKGSCGKLVWAPEGGFIIDTAYVIDSDCTKNDLRWTFYALQPLRLESMSQDTGVPGLARERAYEVQMAFPPRDEQVAIATFLDQETKKIDQLVAEQQRLIEQLEEKRHAVIYHTVTKGLSSSTPIKPSGIEWLGDVPKHWRVIPLKHACRLETGHTPRKSNQEYWVADECSIPWISLNDTKALAAADFIDDTAVKISPLGMANSAAHLIEAGAVVMNRDGARVGLAAITTKPMCVAQHIIAWVCGPTVLNRYLLHVLYAMNDEIYRLAGGSTIPTIGMPEVKSMTIPLPPLDEQTAIVEHLLRHRERCDSLTAQAQRAIELLLERRSALISAAVTGKIDVRDLAGQAEAA